jgi:CHAD domain-containing protein
MEEERKYEVEPSVALPDLTGCLPAGGVVEPADPLTLTATYYDTGDLRLARTGASLRYRRGDDEPWTVKLPSGVPGTRHEISMPGPPDRPPPRLVALVTATTRAAPLRPTVMLRSRRKRYELRDADGGVLAEVADDAVSVLDGPRVLGRFREIEVERVSGDRTLLDAVEVKLMAAGAVAGEFVPKQERALAFAPGPLREAAARPPDVPAPSGEPLERDVRAGDVVTEAIRRSVARILTHDPLMRLRFPLPDGDTAVHQMRVGCRRLRSDLRAFRPLVDRAWSDHLRDQLRWLARVLGAARDAEVLRARLRKVAAADPLAPVDPAAVSRIDANLAAREHAALDAVDDALTSGRYHALLDALAAASAAPRLTALAAASAREVLPDLVSRPWYRLAHGSRGIPGAADLTADAPDSEWHALRVNGKRARYAVEAVADVVGGEAAVLGRRLAKLQDLLGEHQDAAVAAETWLAIAASDPDDHALAVTAGRLSERERESIRRVRADFPAAWRKLDKRRLLGWLPGS